MPEIKHIKDLSPNEGTIRVLEQALESAKKGELRTVLVVEGWDDDSMTHSWSLDSRNTRRRLLSEVVLLQHDFTVNIEFEENDTVLCRAFDA